MEEPKIDNALDDLFEWSEVPEEVREVILAGCRDLVRSFCEEEDIVLSRVAIDVMVDRARIVMPLEMIEVDEDER